MVSLLTTKLCVPPARAQLVPRPRLIERLNAGLGGKLSLISAPAGFGKTTLVTEWLPLLQWPTPDSVSVSVDSQACLPPESKTQDREPKASVAWLSLDENDNDPSRLLIYLVAALQTVDPDIGQTIQAMLQASQPLSPEPLLTSLINDLAAVPRRFVLVLDDYHLIQAPPVHQQLAFLLEHQPAQMHLIILTREDPLLPLARLRARGQITDVRQDDLKFTEEETASFLRRTMQLDLAPAELAALQRRTEGWIAGLQLAALSMQSSDDVRQFVASFTGSHRYILDYLIDEVFRRQRSEVQDFLLKTSILDRLSAALCDAVTERDDSEQVLLALERANLFIVPLDESRQWYRYHQLFRDLLRAQRQALDVTPLYQRAARWCEQNGFLDEAMDYALSARDWDEAERLMEPAAPQIINNGQFATLNRWLGALPEVRLRSSAELAALKAWASLSAGQLAAARPGSTRPKASSRPTHRRPARRW